MTEHSITASNGGVNFHPASELEEILQNVRTIISTQKGTVPLDRDFGLDWAFIDKPINQAKALASAEIAKQIRRYEPRAKIITIELISDIEKELNGILIPKIKIGVNQ